MRGSAFKVRCVAAGRLARMAWRLAVLGVVAAVALLFVPAPRGSAQVTVPSTTSSTKKPTTTTAAPTTTTAAPSTTTTARPRPTTTRPLTTTTQRTTTTIATPTPEPTTTTTLTAVSNHSGRFSPVLTWLAVLGLLSGIGLLVLQWFLTKPGRQGWTL